ncbi:MAG: hypothetical protein ACYC8V_04515 [Caulobacteraceae bacterium]
MRDRYLMPMLIVTALAMIALSLFWPQGLGAASPPPFGHPLPAPQGPPRLIERSIAGLRGAQALAEPRPPR